MADLELSKIILEDVGQKAGKHNAKRQQMQEMGYTLNRICLPVGDYIIANEAVKDVFDRKKKRGIPVKRLDLIGTYDRVVDTKQGLQEIISNICSPQHARFRDECILAQNNGIKLFILIETKEVKTLDDLNDWINPRWSISPNATNGVLLKKAMMTIMKKYGCEFRFTSPEEAGKQVINLLKGADL